MRIVLNTDTLKSDVEELKKIKKCYSTGGNSFLSSSNNPILLANYIKSIRKIYNDITWNINELTEYLNDYISDMEALDNKMNGSSGNIKAANGNSLANTYKNIIEQLQIEDSEILGINKYTPGENDLQIVDSEYIDVNLPATLAICGLSFLEGLANVGENIMDGGAMLIAGGASLLGYDDVANDIGEFVKRDISKELYYNVVSETGLDEYADPDSTAAQIFSTAGNVVGMVGLSVATGGLVSSTFGAGTTAAKVAGGIANGLIGASVDAGTEAESALQRGATIEEAELIGLEAAGYGFAKGAMTGRLDQAARSGVGLGKITKYAFASFAVGASEPLVNEMAHTIIYDHDDSKSLVENFIENAKEYNLPFQMLMAGGMASLGTLGNGLASLEKTKNVKRKFDIDVEKIKTESGLEDYKKLVNDIHNIKEENLPKGFTSVRDYKEQFINELITTGGIKELDLNEIFDLCTDRDMFKTLAQNSDEITRLYKNNLTMPKLLKTLINNDNEDINKLFNNKTMITAIDNLPEDNFKKMISTMSLIGNMTSDARNASNWAGIKTITNKIINMDDKAFSDLISSDISFTEYLKIAIDNKTIDDNTVIKLLNKLDNEMRFNSDLNDFTISKMDLTKIKSDNPKINDLVSKIELKRNKFNDLEIKSSGITEITIKTNGETKVIVSNQSIINLNKEYDFTKTEVTVKSLSEITPQTDLPNTRTLYEIEYVMNGKKMKSLVYSNENGKIDLENTITRQMRENNIKLEDLKIEDISYKKVTSSDIKSSLLEKKFTDVDNMFSSKYYGGDQSDVRWIFEQYINGVELDAASLSKAKSIDKVISSVFPNATDAQKLLLTRAYESNGCGYMAVSNAFNTFLSKNSDAKNLFESKSLFNLLTDDQSSVNLESLALDYYMHVMKETYGNDISIEDMISNSSGLSIVKAEECSSEYFSKFGIEVEIKDSLSDSSLAKTNKEQFNKFIYENTDDNTYFIITSKGFDLEQLDGPDLPENVLDKALSESSKTGKVMSNIGSHAMLVTDLDEDFNPIVSSWSRKFKYSYDSLDTHDNSSMSFFSIGFKKK